MNCAGSVVGWLWMYHLLLMTFEWQECIFYFIILTIDFNSACSQSPSNEAMVWISVAMKLYNSIWVILRAFGAKTPTPTHVKIYKVCIYVTVWVSSVFPWLLEGLTAAWMLWSPTSHTLGSWMQQEKGFCCNKGLLVPALSMEPSHLEEAVGSVECVR